MERRSRTKRISTGKRIEPQERDLLTFKKLDMHGPLASTYLHAFTKHICKDQTRAIKRLGDLYHERNTPHAGPYLERPWQQLQSMNARYQPMVYDLGPNAEKVLIDHDISIISRESTGSQRQYVHRFMVACITASIELEMPDTLRFISEREIIAKAPNGKLQFPEVTISHEIEGKTHRAKVKVVPDRLFGIEYQKDGRKFYRFFALEADRGTMPIIRNNLQQSSYLKKLLAYKELSNQGLYKTHLGIPNLVVLTVTTRERHLESIIKLTQQLHGQSKLFLFKVAEEFAMHFKVPKPMSMLSTGWRRAGLGDERINVV